MGSLRAVYNSFICIYEIQTCGILQWTQLFDITVHSSGSIMISVFFRICIQRRCRRNGSWRLMDDISQRLLRILWLNPREYSTQRNTLAAVKGNLVQHKVDLILLRWLLYIRIPTKFIMNTIGKVEREKMNLERTSWYTTRLNYWTCIPSTTKTAWVREYLHLSG